MCVGCLLSFLSSEQSSGPSIDPTYSLSHKQKCWWDGGIVGVLFFPYPFHRHRSKTHRFLTHFSPFILTHTATLTAERPRVGCRHLRIHNRTRTDTGTRAPKADGTGFHHPLPVAAESADRSEDSGWLVPVSDRCKDTSGRSVVQPCRCLASTLPVSDCYQTGAREKEREKERARKRM